MSTRHKILFSILLAGIVFLGAAIWGYVVDGKPIDPKLLYWLPIFMPVVGFLAWLRWDWAREKGRKKRAERKAEKDAETFE